MTGILPVIGAFLQIVVLILGEWFGSKARARKRKEKYDTLMKEFEEACQKALKKTLDAAKSESEEAQELEDQIDRKL